MPNYKVGNDVYEIPDIQSADFLKDNPKAIEVQSFKQDKDTFDIPIADVNDFLKENPKAEPLKKKEVGSPSLKTVELGYGTLDEALKGTSQSPLQSKSEIKTVPPTKENPLGIHPSALQGIKGSPAPITDPSKFTDEYFDNLNKTKVQKTIKDIPVAKDGNTQVNIPVIQQEYKPVTPAEFITNKFNKEYQTNYTVKQISGQEPVPPPKTTSEALGDKLLESSTNMMSAVLSTPKNLTKIAAQILYAASQAQLTGQSDDIGGQEDQQYNETTKNINKTIDETTNANPSLRALNMAESTLNGVSDKYGKEFNQYVNENKNKHDIIQNAKNFGLELAGIAPLFVVGAILPESAFAGTMMSQQYNAIKDNPNMSEAQKSLNASAIGIINSVGIGYTTKVLKNSFPKLVENVGLKQAQNIAKESIETAVNSSLSKTHALNSVVKGFGNGVGMAGATYLTELLTDPKKEFNPEDLSNEMLHSGFTFAFIHASGAIAGKAYGKLHNVVTKSGKDKVAELGDKIQATETDINKLPDNDPTKILLTDHKENLIQNLNKELAKGDKKIAKLNDEDKVKVHDLNDKVNEIDNNIEQIKNTSIEPTLNDDSKKIIEDKKKVEVENLTEEKKSLEKQIDKTIKNEAKKDEKISEVDNTDKNLLDKEVKNEEISAIPQDIKPTENGKVESKTKETKNAPEGNGVLNEKEKSNLEKIGESQKPPINFREVQNIYNKYGEGKPLNEITSEDFIKSQNIRKEKKGGQNATTKSKEQQQKINQQSSVEEHSGIGASRNEKTSNETDNSNSGENSAGEKVKEGNISKLRHVDIDNLRTNLGLKEIGVRERKSAEQLNSEADTEIKKGYKVGNLLDKIDNGHIPTDVERTIIHKYTNILNDELENIKDVNSKEFDKKLNELDRITRQAKSAASEAGAALKSIQNSHVLDTSLGSYLLREKDANNDAPLTEQQKETVVKEFIEISQTQKDLEKRLTDLQDEVNFLKAKQNIRKTKPISKPKTHEEYVTERKLISEGIREKLKKFHANINVSIIPYADQLIAISPDVAKLVKSHIDEKVDDLKVIIDNIHETLKSDIPQITKKDVQDIIAGVYNEKKVTRNEDTKKLYELKQEAKLLNKIEDLQNGVQPKSERGKIVYNQRLEELRKQIKENDLTKIAAYKTRILSETTKIEQALKEGNYEPEQKKAPLVLDKATRELKDKLIRLKQEREVRLMQQQYNNRNKYEKTRDKLIDIANVPRTLMSSMDFSAPLRQALVATVSHPIMASKAGLEMFKQSISQKRFDRWFHEVKEDPQYPISQQSGLYIADPHDPRLTAKEEMFMNNISEKIPVVGGLVKGSERAYVGYLNKMRWDLFTRFSEFYQSQGRTFENSPELYKGLASYVNNSTGRGKIGALESAAPILNSVFFSPRLIASRLNFLNPVYYAKLPKEVRILAIKDVAKFVGLGMTVLALASLNGAEVEGDPRSSDFGKIKIGNTRWDIWGGYQQYIRVFAQLMSGEKKLASGEMKKLNGEGAFGETRMDLIGNFVRGKLAPVPSIAVDYLKGRTIVGEPFSLKNEAIQHLSPLTFQDISEAVKDRGISAIFTVGIPSTFGVGVQTYKPKNGLNEIINKTPEQIDVDIEKHHTSKEKQKENKLKGNEILENINKKADAREQIFNRTDLTDEEKRNLYKEVKPVIKKGIIQHRKND